MAAGLGTATAAGGSLPTFLLTMQLVLHMVLQARGSGSSPTMAPTTLPTAAYEPHPGVDDAAVSPSDATVGTAFVRLLGPAPTATACAAACSGWGSHVPRPPKCCPPPSITQPRGRQQGADNASND